MPAPLSLDLRQRIVDAYQRHEGSQAQLARRFNVGKATVERLIRRFNETGSVQPKPHGRGRKPLLTQADRDDLIQAFKDDPDLRQADLAQRYSEAGRPMSEQVVGRALRRMGITRKKRV